MSKLLTKEDLSKLVRDSVGAAVASRMLEAEKTAAEAARKRELEDPVIRSKGFGELMRELMSGKGYSYPQATGDRDLGIVINDPHKGRGLAFARAVKANLVGKMDGRSALDVAKEWSTKNRAYEGTVRAMSEGTFASGGSLVPPEASAEFVEMLYAATVTTELGARRLDFNSRLDLGKQNSSATAYWVGEGTAITPSSPGTGTIGLNRRKVAALVGLTNELLRNPSVSADTFVRDDLIKVMALKRDLAAIRGPGTEYQPRGIKNWINSANSNAMTGSVTLATIVADLMKAVRLVDESDVQLSRPGWIVSPRVKWYLAGLLDGNGNHVFLQMLMTGNLYGFPLKTTTQIPNNLGGGTESEVYFGTFDELIDGHDVGTPLQVETFPNGTYHDGSAPVYGVSSDQSVIRAIEGCDFVVRHNKSFSMITGVTWGA